MSLIVYGQKISDDDTQSIVLQDPGSRSLVVMNKESGEISLLRQIRGPHKDTGGKRDARLISSYFCPQCGSEIGTGFDLASVEQAPGQGTGSFVHENYFKLLERRSSQTQLPSIEQPSVIPSNLFTPGYYRRFFKELSLLGSGAVSYTHLDVYKRQVHGHIHNFNNITYIHGHVHRTSSSADLPLGLFKDQDTVDIQSAPVGASGSRDATGSLQFAPGTAVVPSGSSMPATGFGSVTTDDPAPCLQYKDCQHFEFMNYHDLNIFGEGRPKTAPDELLIRPDKKRKVTSCPGQPRVVELCCEDNHTIDSAEPNAMNNDDLVLFANGGVPECPTHETTAPVHSSLPNFIDCDLTCAPTFSEEDELFESLCAQCVDLDQHDPSSAHEHSHTTTHEQCSQQERPHSYNQGHTQQCHADEQGHVPCASSQSTSGHYHVINASTDMKIIEELANISNMYDFPFGKHVHSHDTGKEDTKGKEDNYNLLQTCLPEVKTESLGESYKNCLLYTSRCV